MLPVTVCQKTPTCNNIHIVIRSERVRKSKVLIIAQISISNVFISQVDLSNSWAPDNLARIDDSTEQNPVQLGTGVSEASLSSKY